MRDRDGGRDGRERGRGSLGGAAADRGREAAREPFRQLDRARDQATIRRQVDRWRILEAEHPDWCHSFAEHVEAGDRVLAARAATGVNARGERRVRPEHATRWQSGEAMTVAAHGLWFSDERRRVQQQAIARDEPQFSVRLPLSHLMGPGWRADVYGRSRESHGASPSRWSAQSRAVGVWRRQADGRWHLHTCYPEAAGPPG